MKIENDTSRFTSLTENGPLWNEVLNTSDRNAALVASAAFDVLLERLLLAFLVQDSAISKGIAKKSSFANKINLCFSLGLISEEEMHDLNLLRDIRNAFAHNLFDCDFENPKVKIAISNLQLPKKANADHKSIDLRACFNIGMVVLDASIKNRAQTVAPVNRHLDIAVVTQKA
ncbi:DUF4145 domain-containing protein [Microbulbifer agarilyticus]|uniref:DUF4145 domain-containing protein n=1 Tax=Microbulbifer agarilyticus TaxID=260552 RepID=UPI001CD74E42|nr:DUF4145 domain-containing protein [Microbulbifer agarilyticus]MCA0902030.1 hypothetical protein [Microbulbifer agarilyticus]